MKVGIVGNHNYKDYEFIHKTLSEKHKDISHIFCGGQRPVEFVRALPRYHGVDYFASKYAKRNSLTVTICFKDSSLANNYILQVCDTIIVFWDGKNNQTKNFIEKAKNQKKKIYIYG